MMDFSFVQTLGVLYKHVAEVTLGRFMGVLAAMKGKSDEQ